MSTNFPIYSIAKELNIDSSKIILACKNLGINAKGATKKLNEAEKEKVKSYFDKGKNVSQETIDINEINTNDQIKINKKKLSKKNIKNNEIKYFGNRLMGKNIK